MCAIGTAGREESHMYYHPLQTGALWPKTRHIANSAEKKPRLLHSTNARPAARHTAPSAKAPHRNRNTAAIASMWAALSNIENNESVLLFLLKWFFLLEKKYCKAENQNHFRLITRIINHLIWSAQLGEDSRSQAKTPFSFFFLDSSPDGLRWYEW